ncbi:Deneddylase [Citrus sinensis]|uniref:Deneddylase n=1 Tax=Citrus sinensis TaxID=2711 RepID=A0ACB8NHW4_CITSI|nr:Deneddylase [Citrus sinensis]
MAHIHVHTLFSPTFCIPRSPLTSSRNHFAALSCTSPKTTASLSSEQDVLQAVVESDGKTLPCVRTYENDLVRLSLFGAVGFDQALTAAAADGGQAANEHVVSGIPAMVVETVFPGPSGERATISTRLVPASFALTSSDERVISVLAEVVCLSALQSTESHFLDNSLRKTSSYFFRWFQKPKRITSKDSSVVVYKLFEDEIVENAKTLLETFNSTKESIKPVKMRSKHLWWTPSAHSKLEKIGGREFSIWTSENVPAYRLEIDVSRYNDVKLEGWRKSAENRWEILLTHSQMVGLADILDMYYEDIFSLPNKQLSCSVVTNYTNLPSKKRDSSFLKILSVTLASGIFLVAISALGQRSSPHLHKGEKFSGELRSLASSEIWNALRQPVDAVKLEEMCVSIIKRIKDTFDWPGDIMTEMSIGAWIGEIPNYLKLSHEDDSTSEGNLTAALEKIDPDIKSSMQDIASYQVVLSTEGKIVGFQPTSRVGVNHWAASPLAKEMYGGRKLSPGLIEPSLKIHLPNEVVLIELLMSVNPDSCFALARPIQ